MHIIGTIFKWLFGIVMVICLVAGVIALLGTGISQDVMPTSLSELDTVKVSITEQLTKEGSRTGILHTQEYPEGTLLMSTKSGYTADAADITLKPGDQIEIYVRKQDIPHLNSPEGVIVWGARGADGKTLLDPNLAIDFSKNPVMKGMNQFSYVMIGVPVLYFLGLIFFRKKKKPAG